MAKGYATGICDYIIHTLPLDPMHQTLSCYITNTSQFIVSGLKYLTGVCHFLKDLYPDFNTNQRHLIV
ncbi:uncharacterized protein BT62DRAFT_903308 [Guyanagaster necrorhizus]|uniref:Uncharacterized protein n=1 Tax=Guyanagaster necrorhizus TaxID=856835 RepID=A0A9P8APU5_9AGAR|nr:uncharacterized protein BT62DRAFT_903308 [Guyanagaster necrorhizus MCA 3950]KAG7443374.1 hypothetical protein BT62DRAFT_903308 [Guyanagaster necrorhizus MCA 3950]